MKHVAGVSLLAVAVLIGSTHAPPAEASTRWRDVYFDVGDERYGSVAAYDRGTQRILVLTRIPFGRVPQIASYAPGRSEPVWTRTFASVPNSSQTSSYASDLLVVPERHLVYVAGGYLSGWGSGPFTTAGYLYAFDTRTGKQLWSRSEASSPGMGSIYDHLANGPDGSVLAVSLEFVRGPHNSSGSYALEVSRFGRGGRKLWRWTDSRRGLADDVTETRTGLFVLIGETYVDGYARAYRLALNKYSGRLEWRHVSSDPWSYVQALSASKSGRMLYVAGSHDTDDGSQATIRAVAAETGRVRWTRRISAPEPLLPGDLSYYASTAVTTTRTGPCLTGEWEGRRVMTYEPLLPDDGFIACYSPKGTRRWLDRSTAAQGRVLEAAGRRLLWIGHQAASRAGSTSEEVLRFAIRSLGNGSILHSSERRQTTNTWEPSDPLLATRHRSMIHFVVATSSPRAPNGEVVGPRRLLDRVFE